MILYVILSLFNSKVAKYIPFENEEISIVVFSSVKNWENNSRAIIAKKVSLALLFLK